MDDMDELELVLKPKRPRIAILGLLKGFPRISGFERRSLPIVERLADEQLEDDDTRHTGFTMAVVAHR
jgi:hypothetical protein